MNLNNPQDITRLKQYAFNEVKKFGRLDLLDDFTQFAAEAIVRGRKATVPQLFIDFIRDTLGDSRYDGSRKPKSKSMVGLEYLKGTGYVDKHSIDYNSITEFYDGVERAILILYYKWGMTMAEVGDVLGVSEGRVSQIFKELSIDLKKNFTDLPCS